MDFLDFLNGLERTLEEIEVKGRQNHDYLMGCFLMIDKAKDSYLAMQRQSQIEDGENNGRQTNIGTDTSDSNK